MRRLPVLRSLSLITPLMLVAACGGSDAEMAGEEGDPALTGALEDQISVDPDMAGANQGNSALGASDGDGALPAAARSPEAIARAEAEALEMLGGTGSLKKAPAAQEVSGELPQGATLTAAARAAASPVSGANCADKAEYSNRWAARLPDATPVYPRGAVQEAAGTDDGSCALRVVNYLTPVDAGDVIDFYYSSASKAGYSVQRVREGGDDVIGGTKGKGSFIAYVRKLPSGITEVDLIANGG